MIFMIDNVYQIISIRDIIFKKWFFFNIVDSCKVINKLIAKLMNIYIRVITIIYQQNK